MVSPPSDPAGGGGDNGVEACINDVLTDDELRAVLARLGRQDEKDTFGLVCRRWFRIQSLDRHRLSARAGPAMLRRLAARFGGVLELDLSQSASRSFYPGVVDADLEVIAAGFTNLRSLNLRHCKGVSDVGMRTIGAGLPKLEKLDVSYCKKLSDHGLTAVASGCRDLKSLHASGCHLLTDSLLRSLSTSCGKLENLELVSCANITNDGLSALANGRCRISHLDVSKCGKVGDNGVSRLAASASSSLVVLKLLDCDRVGDESVSALADKCPSLEKLVIGGCRHVTDDSVQRLASAGSLTSLRMDWCVNITNVSVAALLSNCRRLVALDIGCCDKVTDSAFQELVAAGFEPQLKVLKASNCVQLSVVGLRAVLQCCHQLEYLDLRSCPQATREMCQQASVEFPERCRVNFDRSLAESDRMVDVDSFF